MTSPPGRPSGTPREFSTQPGPPSLREAPAPGRRCRTRLPGQTCGDTERSGILAARHCRGRCRSRPRTRSSRAPSPEWPRRAPTSASASSSRCAPTAASPSTTRCWANCSSAAVISAAATYRLWRHGTCTSWPLSRRRDPCGWSSWTPASGAVRRRAPGSARGFVNSGVWPNFEVRATTASTGAVITDQAADASRSARSFDANGDGIVLGGARHGEHRRSPAHFATYLRPRSAGDHPRRASFVRGHRMTSPTALRDPNGHGTRMSPATYRRRSDRKPRGKKIGGGHAVPHRGGRYRVSNAWPWTAWRDGPRRRRSCR